MVRFRHGVRSHSARANESVVPLVTPLIVPRQATNETKLQENNGSGFPGNAGVLEIDPGFGEVPIVPDVLSTGSPDLFRPIS